MRATPKLRMERMEDRLTPAGFGNAWVDTNLTVSFAPDGTDVAGIPSSLYRTLGGRATPDEWQGAIAAAFQTWIAPTNLNFAFVSDDGRPVGSPGPVQGSPFVGDIRISARPLSGNVLAITNPFDLVSPWAGEIILNSNKAFDTDGSAGTNCLYTVLLQEIGHALGVGNSTDPASVMYETYGGGRAGLSQQDVAAAQSLYGVRTVDRFDTGNGNATLMSSSGLSYIQNVTDLAGTDGTQGATPFVAAGDLTTPDDVDVYYVTPPKFHTNPTVVVQTGGLSAARLKVSVYYHVASDGGNVGRLLATTSTPDANGNYVLPFSRTADWFTYYVKVEAAAEAGPFRVGSYRLAMGNGLTTIPASQYTTRVSTSGDTVTESADWAAGKPANDTLATATLLGSARSTADARWDFSGTATLGAPADVDVYQVRTTAKSGGVMFVSVTTPAGTSAPRVKVYDSKGNQLTAEVLMASDGGAIVQVLGVKQNSTYHVAVSGDPAKWAGVTQYQLGIDFRTAAVTLDTFATGRLTDAQPGLFRTLDVNRSQAFRFQMAASGVSGAAGATLTIYDEARNVVFTLSAVSGQTVIGDVLLAPGRYTIAISGDPGVFVDGRFLALTDPIGIAAPADPTIDPSVNRIAPPSEPFTWTCYDPSYYAWLM